MKHFVHSLVSLFNDNCQNKALNNVKSFNEVVKAFKNTQSLALTFKTFPLLRYKSALYIFFANRKKIQENKCERKTHLLSELECFQRTQFKIWERNVAIYQFVRKCFCIMLIISWLPGYGITRYIFRIKSFLDKMKVINLSAFGCTFSAFESMQ